MKIPSDHLTFAAVDELHNQDEPPSTRQDQKRSSTTSTSSTSSASSPPETTPTEIKPFPAVGVHSGAHFSNPFLYPFL